MGRFYCVDKKHNGTVRTQGDGSIVLTNLSEYDILSVGVRKCLDNQDKRAKAEYII